MQLKFELTVAEFVELTSTSLNPQLVELISKVTIMTGQVDTALTEIEATVQTLKASEATLADANASLTTTVNLLKDTTAGLVTSNQQVLQRLTDLHTELAAAGTTDPTVLVRLAAINTDLANATQLVGTNTSSIQAATTTVAAAQITETGLVQNDSDALAINTTN
jgi:hypothetical protein